MSTSCFIPHSHGAPGMRGAGQAEDGSALRQEAGRVSGVVPETRHHTLLIARHHQVAISWRPVDCCDCALKHKAKVISSCVPGPFVPPDRGTSCQTQAGCLPVLTRTGGEASVEAAAHLVSSVFPDQSPAG